MKLTHDQVERVDKSITEFAFAVITTGCTSKETIIHERDTADKLSEKNEEETTPQDPKNPKVA